MCAIGAALAVVPAVPAAAAPTNCSTGLIGNQQAMYAVCAGGTGWVQMAIVCTSSYFEYEAYVSGSQAPVGVRSEAYCPPGPGWGISEYWYSTGG